MNLFKLHLTGWDVQLKYQMNSGHLKISKQNSHPRVKLSRRKPQPLQRKTIRDNQLKMFWEIPDGKDVYVFGEVNRLGRLMLEVGCITLTQNTIICMYNYVSIVAAWHERIHVCACMVGKLIKSHVKRRGQIENTRRTKDVHYNSYSLYRLL